MEAKELRDMSADDLREKLATLREEIGHLTLKRATSRLENPMKLRRNQAGSWPGWKPFCAKKRSRVQKG